MTAGKNITVLLLLASAPPALVLVAIITDKTFVPDSGLLATTLGTSVVSTLRAMTFLLREGDAIPIRVIDRIRRSATYALTGLAGFVTLHWICRLVFLRCFVGQVDAFMRFVDVVSSTAMAVASLFALVVMSIRVRERIDASSKRESGNSGRDFRQE